MFRVVNGKDLVARIPRSSRTNRLLQYEHVGSAVVVGDSDLGPLHISPTSAFSSSSSAISISNSEVTVTSSSQRSTYSNSSNSNSTTYTSPNQIFTMGSENDRFSKLNFSSLDRLRVEGTEVIQQWLGSGSRTNSSKLKESYLVQLSDMLLKGLVDEDNWSMEEIAATLLNTTTTKFMESKVSFPDFSNATAVITTLLASAIEPETTFIDKEVKFLQSILDGRALEHHMEPSYYRALESAITQLSTITSNTSSISDN